MWETGRFIREEARSNGSPGVYWISIVFFLQVLIWHDNTGLTPSWFLSRVIVRDLQTSKKYYFLCEDWLCLWKGDGVIQRDLDVASK